MTQEVYNSRYEFFQDKITSRRRNFDSPSHFLFCVAIAVIVLIIVLDKAFYSFLSVCSFVLKPKHTHTQKERERERERELANRCTKETIV